jgi:hypothetical protein
MEVSIFPKPGIVEHLKKLVEVRLHTDKRTEKSAGFQELKVRLTGSHGNPVYLIQDPTRPDKVLGRFDGADLLTGGKEFAAFLGQHVK